MGASPSTQQEKQSPSFNLANSQQQQPQTTTSSPPSLQSQSQSPYPYTNHNPTLSQSGQNLQLRPMANAGISQTVNENARVVLDGSKSYDPNHGSIIVGYQWTELPMGVPITLIGANTATPTFTAPVVHTVLGFSLRVMDNHVAVSNNLAVVYVIVKHNPNIGPTGSSNIPSAIITQPQLQQLHQPIIPNNNAISSFPLPSTSGPPSSISQTGLPAIHSPVVP